MVNQSVLTETKPEQPYEERQAPRWGPLVIDGTDRCGKDSLVAALRALVAGELTPLVIHNTKPTGPRPHRDAVERYSLEYALATKAPASTLTVMNRGHLSEAVYGSLYRGGAPDWRLAEMFLPESAVVVVLERDADQILEDDDGASTFGTGPAAKARLISEQKAFRRALTNCGLPNDRKLLVTTGWPSDRARVVLAALARHRAVPA